MMMQFVMHPTIPEDCFFGKIFMKIQEWVNNIDLLIRNRKYNK